MFEIVSQLIPHRVRLVFMVFVDVGIVCCDLLLSLLLRWKDRALSFGLIFDVVYFYYRARRLTIVVAT